MCIWVNVCVRVMSVCAGHSVTSKYRYTCTQHSVSNKHIHVIHTPVLSCPILSYPVLSCPILSYHVQSCPILSYHVRSCPILFYPVLSCSILSYPVLSCPILSYPVLSSSILWKNAFIRNSMQLNPLKYHFYVKIFLWKCRKTQTILSIVRKYRQKLNHSSLKV